MEITFHGAGCVSIATKKATVVVDDDLDKHGAKPVTKPGSISLFTYCVDHTVKDAKLVIQQPGEYEVSTVSVQGIAAKAHIDHDEKKRNTIYKIIADDFRIAVTGNIAGELTEDQLEQIGTVDILVVPVGGFGLTMDGLEALKLIKKVEPKIIIPVHYDQKDITYEVTQAPLDEAVKALTMEIAETLPTLKLKSTSEIGEQTRLIVLEKG